MDPHSKSQQGFSMLVIRTAKILSVASVATFAALVAFGNVSDYDTNFAFVQHVLSMDTIFERSTIRYRAITDPTLHHAAYALIIVAEAATAILCWSGVVILLRNFRAGARTFNRSKLYAVIGLLLGFLLWQFGFITIGGEWFGMWQSQQWNGVPSAFRFAMVIVAVLILLILPDDELDVER